jgi:hypothetical protein
MATSRLNIDNSRSARSKMFKHWIEDLVDTVCKQMSKPHVIFKFS